MCGIAAAVSNDLSAAGLVYGMLALLQNRAEEAAGIAISGGCHEELLVAKGGGKVYQVFPDHIVPLLRGRSGIGHVRYSTNGGSNPKGAHPFLKGDVAVAHNGNLINTEELRQKLPRDANLEFGSDTEIIAEMIGRAKGDLYERIVQVCPQLKGSYTLTALDAHGTVAIARDPNGIRPGMLGRWVSENGAHEAVLAASESTPITHIGGQLLPDVAPGEVVLVHPDRCVERRQFASCTRCAFCIFEQIYFARPTSSFFGVSCFEFRKALGAELLREMGLDSDPNTVVMPILNSGLGGARGFAEAGGIRYDPAIINTGLAGRTFILPEQLMREMGVNAKHIMVDQPPGLTYVIIDDSIVRGTTLLPIIRLIRRYAPKRIIVAIPCPPFMHRCMYGIDTPSDEELIANRLHGEIDLIRQEIGADSLHYLSLGGLHNVVRSFGWDPKNFCMACFDGDYPVAA